MAESGRRLTSWKEIAAHFGRDVRTVMRWEKERALPVHRGPNGKTGVVMAETSELDAWARGVGTPVAPAPGSDLRAGADTGDATRSEPVARRGRWTIAAAMVLATAIGLGGWRAHVSNANEQPDAAVLTERALVALNADGSELWRHNFPGERVSAPFSRTANPVEPLAGEGLLAATAYSVITDNLTVRSGRLMLFDRAGTIRQSFSFEDTVRFGARDFSGPWSLNDYRQRGSGSARRIAVTAHHYEWWPSIVTMLDARWQRQDSFIHAGWIEWLRWLPGDRLAISGFSNLKDGGMIALLDANALNGQSPAAPGSEFECAACGPDRPLRYVILPRSEVNRASASPFNRASFEVRAAGLLVRTSETAPIAAAPAGAIYEFTPELTLLHAAYTDRYWEVHRELETLGKLTHTRERCPDRDGPPQIEIWDRASGWTVHTVRRTTSR